MNCAVHPHVELLMFCPACRGSNGGKRNTPAQRENYAKNAERARLGGGRPKGAKDKHPRKKKVT